MTWGSKGKDSLGKGFKGKGSKGRFKGQNGLGKPMQQAWQNAGKLPEALRKAGCVAMDNQNRRRCFAYNLDGCTDAAPGEACSRGWHLCAKKGCDKPHPQHAHPSE